MKLNFTHDYEKDIWCLFAYGKGSNNSPTLTKRYEQLTVTYGETPTKENAHNFIDAYINENKIDITTLIAQYQKEWSLISKTYEERAEAIFGVTLPENITAYLTVSDRYPYNIPENFFFVGFNPKMVLKIAMHELWHFYTWYKFGTDEERLGKEKYNEMKESLTVLLNAVCADLLPEGIQDVGYPQHAELRKKILCLWNDTNDIEGLWRNIS